MNSVDVGGLTVTYERTGSGDPVLFLHGSPGDGKTWTPQLEALADEFTVVAWDMPGTGGSDDPPETFSLLDYADCAAEFARAVGLESAHIVGLSFGGGLAIQIYDRHASIPRSLVLIGAYAGWAGSLPPNVMEKRLALYQHYAELTPDEFVEQLLPTMFTPATPIEITDLFAEAIRGTHAAGLRVSSRAFADADLRHVLPRITVPTLLVYGDKDVRAPLEVANAMHASIPGSELVVYDGIGHVANIEASERFNADLRSFLRRN